MPRDHGPPVGLRSRSPGCGGSGHPGGGGLMRPRKPHDAPSHWPPGSGPGCVPADLQRHTPKSKNLSHQMTSPAQGPRRSGSARSIPGTSLGGLSPPDRPWLASPSPSSGRRGPSLQWGPPSSTPTKPPMLTKGCGGVASPLPLTPPGSASGSNLGDTAGWVGTAETSGCPTSAHRRELDPLPPAESARPLSPRHSHVGGRWSAPPTEAGRKNDPLGPAPGTARRKPRQRSHPPGSPVV